MAKRRIWKWLFALFGVVVVLAGIALAVVFSSSFQTSMVLKALRASDPEASVQRVAFGLGGGEVQELKLRLPGGQSVALHEAVLKYSLKNLLFGDVKVIENASVKGLVVDASGPSAPAKTPAPADLGASGQPAAKLPKVLVRQADLEGEVRLPGDRRVRATLSAQNLGAGGDGTAKGDILFLNAAKGATVPRMSAGAALGVQLTEAYKPVKFSLTGNVDASIPGQTPLPPLQIQAGTGDVRNGERPVTLALGPAGAKLAEFTGTLGDDGSLSGQFTVNCTRAQLEPYAFGTTLPDFTVRGNGTLAANPAKREGSFKASLTADAANLGRVQQNLAALGAIQVTVQTDLGWNGTTYEARQLSLALSPASGSAALSLDLARPITLETANGQMKVAGGSAAELARLDLRAAPAAWLAAFAPAGYEISGNSWSGQVVLGANDDGTIVAQTPQPLTLAGISIARAATPAAPRALLLGGATLLLDAGATYKDGRTQAEVRRLVLSAGATVLVQLQGKIINAPGAGGNAAAARLEADGRIAADVDQLARQPFAAAWAANLPSGELLFDGTFTAARTATAAELSAVQVSLRLNDTPLLNLQLVQKFSLPLGAGQTLPPLSGDLLTLDAANLPFDLLRPFLPANVRASGEPVRGRLAVAGLGGAEFAAELKTVEPLVLPRVTYTQILPPDPTLGTVEKPVLRDVSITLAPQGKWSAQQLSATVRLQVASPAGSILDASLEAAQTEGKLEAALAASGDIGVLSQQPLGATWRGFLPTPAPQFTLSTKLARDDKGLTVTTVQAKIQTPGATPVVLGEVRLLQPFAVPSAPADAAAAWPLLRGDVLALKLDNLPVGLLDVAVPGMRFQGEKISADFIVRGDGTGTYAVASNGPFAVSRLTLQRVAGSGAAETLVSNLTATGRPMLQISQKGLQSFAAPDLALSSGDTNLAKGSLEAGFAAGATGVGLSQLKFNLAGDVAQLLAQPVLAPFNNLSAGQAALDGEWAADGRLRLSAELANFVVRDPARSVGSLKITNATGTVRDGAVQVTLPVTGQGVNGATDCNVTFSLAAPGATPAAARPFTAQATGRSLVVDDVMAVANAFRPPAAKPRAAVVDASAPDTQPFWGAATGTAKVDLQRVVYNQIELGGARADVAVSPTRLTFSNTSAQVAGGPFNVGAVLAFEQAQPRLPYALQATLAVKDFNTVDYFRAQAPNKVPPVAGNFTMDGSASGRGANLTDLIDKVNFDVKLSSQGGSFRLLDQVSPAARQAVQGMQVVTGLGGLVASLGGQKEIAGGLQLAEALLIRLKVLNYTQLAFAAQRGQDLNINLTQFVLQDPELAIFGSGKLVYQPGKGIPALPMQVTFRLDARGTPAQQLSGVGLLTQQTDSLGYNQGPQFAVTGTVSEPNYDSLYLLLFRAAAGAVTNAAGGNANRLLNGLGGLGGN